MAHSIANRPLVFAYYRRLNAEQKRIYRQSDQVTSVPVRGARRLHPLTRQIAVALAQERRVDLERRCRELLAELVLRLEVPPVRVSVLAVRPHDEFMELHGAYEPAHGRKRGHIMVWMRTARRRQAVAFRTFYRTLLHELCHHLDFELLALADSFHTEGFYKRESSLYHQLVPQSLKTQAATKKV